ncbi:hypothetical protein AB0D24_06380 [Streptomyces javensis]|uniref:hypothetical protein n=1 Tax=Streptomyces javensis TaxID=114698 RepID=UPI00340D6F55
MRQVHPCNQRLGECGQIAHVMDLLDGDLKRRRHISDADVTDAINWVERIALAIGTVLG